MGDLSGAPYYEAKRDQGKARWWLLPWDALAGVVKVLEFGLAKGYREESWRTVPDARERYWNALLRHMVAARSGEERDPESGLPHVYHVATNALFLAALWSPCESSLPSVRDARGDVGAVALSDVRHECLGARRPCCEARGAEQGRADD